MRAFFKSYFKNVMYLTGKECVRPRERVRNACTCVREYVRMLPAHAFVHVGRMNGNDNAAQT